jgi:2-keto-4-pentenoate hydratase/2-oxohepta-3-ene-1,7-dioic acid hydratase in catechol pathway
MNIICVGRNYIDHIKELNNNIPKNPVIFFKPETSLNESSQFKYPSITNNLHYEVELVFKIKKKGKNIKKIDAKTHIDSIGIGIDFTARDIQSIAKERRLPWDLSKGFDNSASISIFKKITFFKNINNLNFSLYKNKKEVQNGNSKLMIYKIDFLIHYISKYVTLNKGDLIFTGTPKGVGPVNIGDKLEAYIENEKLLITNII